MATSKLQRIKTCKNCQTEFTANKVTAVFCSDRCRKASTRTKAKRSTRDESFTSDRFFQRLRDAIHRAGTLEILGPRGEVDLVALDKFLAYADGAQGFRNNKSLRLYEVCHLAPARAEGELGLFTLSNLYIGTADFNRSIGNRRSPVGQAIEKTLLDDEWRVSALTTDTQLKAKLTKYVGKTEMERFLAARPTKLTGIAKQRKELLKWQGYLLAGDVPETAPDAVVTLLHMNVESSKGEDVKAVYTALQGHMDSGLSINKAAHGITTIITHEAERMLAFANGSRADALRSILAFLPMIETKDSPFPDRRIATFGMQSRDMLVEEFELAVMETFHGDHGAWFAWLEDAMSDITLHLPSQDNLVHQHLIELNRVAPFQPAFIPFRPDLPTAIQTEDEPKAQRLKRAADWKPKWEIKLDGLIDEVAELRPIAITQAVGWESPF